MNPQQSPGATTVRRAKACTTCRRKKTKCDGKRPVCSPCNAFNLPCGFQDVLRHSSRSSRAYVEELERRVQDMERQLQEQSHGSPEHRPSYAPTRRSNKRPRTTRANSPDQPGGLDNQSPFSASAAYEPEEDGVQSNSATEPNQASYVINADGKRMRFFGASSGFSIASPQGLTWLESQTRSGGWNHAGQRNASRWQLSNWYPRILRPDIQQRVFQPLPSKAATVELVSEYFASFNKAIPLFNQTLFNKLVDKQFGWNPDESPSWWAALNLVLASAYRERAQKSRDGSGEWQKSMGHIRNALNVVVELLMCAADLLSVQAMLGLALLFQNTPNPQPLFMFAAAAMRLAQSVGLHRKQESGLSPLQIEERRRIFWIAFSLDADISHRTGRPAVQDANDFDTPLPPKSPSDGLGVLRVQGVQLSYFHFLARFAVIQRQIYGQLYSATSSSKSVAEFAEALKGCEQMLREWRESFASNYSADLAFSLKPDYHLQHVLRLDAAYHCCYAKLYQLCILTRRSMARAPQDMEDPADLETQINDTIAKSLESARSAVMLIKHINSYGPAFVWGVVYFPAAASVTLSTHVLADPAHQLAASDLDMARQTIQFLNEVTSEEPGTYADYILGLCSELESAATKVLNPENSHSQQSTGYLNNFAPYIDTNRVSFADAAIPSNIGGFGTIGSTDIPKPGVLPQGYDIPSVDPTFDLAMNLQWPMAPFWNWGDAMPGVTVEDMGSEQ
ncbi:fungal-specific transcription factor domain-containing protein [Aspergillus avenaceus]|uniref:Fungal-specific transcription factor domain-containing protein n=1 Tax=Aspergillus avenaceus TaxID=36643 RepID=A0A5N6U139_ASPAV|nr:fungal-specific transcription factor domain-containing protein [Aspergillus avenaceus]